MQKEYYVYDVKNGRLQFILSEDEYDLWNETDRANTQWFVVVEKETNQWPIN